MSIITIQCISYQTVVTRRFEDMSDNVRKQLQIIAEKSEYFSIALDGSCDLGDTSQVLVFVRGVDSEFSITEDLATLQSLYETTRTPSNLVSDIRIILFHITYLI